MKISQKLNPPIPHHLLAPHCCLALAAAFILLVILVAPAQAGGDQETSSESEVMPWDMPASGLVGSLGDVDRIDFTGNTTFTAENIRHALLLSPEFLLGSHHLEQRETYLTMLQQKLVEGYQANGFPEAQVKAAVDETAGRVKVAIVEGRRFRCGKVHVAGVTNALAEAIITRLTKPVANSENSADSPGTSSTNHWNWTATASLSGPDDKHPLDPRHEPDKPQTQWLPGEPVPFGASPLANLKTAVEDVLGENGYFFPRVDLQIDQGKDGTAALRVEVTDPPRQGWHRCVEGGGD
jgi:hypothetical protein